MSERTVFNRVDTAIFDLDRTPDPWSVHCEVRVEGRLDAERLAAAALAAVRRHAMARARMEPVRLGARTLQWVVDDDVAAVPLEIVDCEDDAGVGAARSRLLSRRIDLHVAPPLALALVHHPDGDFLMMNLSHVVGDGISSYRLMTSICRAYAGVDDPTPDMPLALVRNLRGYVGSRNLNDAATRLRGIRGLVSDFRTHGNPIRVAVEGGVAAPGFGFQLMRFNAEDAALINSRRTRPATINDLLLAAVAITIRRFNDERGVAPGRISFMMPVNLRPAEWSNELVSNIVSYVPVSLTAAEQADLTSAERAVCARTTELKDQRQAGTLVAILGMTSIWPAAVRQAAIRLTRPAIVNPLLDTAVLSNLGNLPEPLNFGPGAGNVTELWFSPPASMPLGTAIGAVSMNQQMFLTLRYCNPQFDAAGAAAFASVLREVLLGP